MEKIKVYFCDDANCTKDIVPASFTIREVIEHFTGSFNPCKLVCASGKVPDVDDLISEPKYLVRDEDKWAADVVYYTKMVNP